MRPSALEGVTIESQGCRLFGGMYLAAGDAPAPGVVLLHGIPGHELNLDLAQWLRSLGFHVLFFHYRGAWGSEGDYSLQHCLPDSLAAIDFLRARPDVDPTRLGLVGLSLGGWAALAAASLRPQVRAVVAIAPLIDPARPMGGDGMALGLATEFARPLRGIHPERLVQEWRMLPPMAEMSSALSKTPILLITADRDEVFPPAHYAGAEALFQRLDWVHFPGADHVFSSVRPGLCHTIGTWLLDQMA